MRDFFLNLRFIAVAVLLATALSPPVQAGSMVKTIVAFGDSLTAGLGVPLSDAWPTVLARNLKARGLNIRMINAGVSGDTTAGGRARLGWSLSGADGLPDMVIVALGGNDVLRGLSPVQARQNLDAIIGELVGRDIKVLLAGMRAPPNLGVEYGEALTAIYRDLADKHGVDLYPFILDGVAADPALNQPDGIHPNTRGHAIIARRIEPYVRLLITAE
jgi:acyl-CoA thioesterase-1